MAARGLHDLGRGARHGVGLVRGAACRLLRKAHFLGWPSFRGRTPRIVGAGRMVVGSKFTTDCRVFRSELSTGESGSLRIGDRVFLNQGVRIHAANSVVIGNRVEIADLVCIYDTNFHSVAPGGETKIAPVIIGDDCWLGAHSIVLPGVILGRAVVVAAGAVVTKSFPEGSVVAGNPAEVVRTFHVPENFRRR